MLRGCVAADAMTRLKLMLRFSGDFSELVLDDLSQYRAQGRPRRMNTRLFLLRPAAFCHCSCKKRLAA
jgi:hypothetical protein